MLNTDLLLDLADHLDRIPAKTFDWSTPWKRPFIGCPHGCIVGHAAHLCDAAAAAEEWGWLSWFCHHYNWNSADPKHLRSLANLYYGHVLRPFARNMPTVAAAILRYEVYQLDPDGFCDYYQIGDHHEVRPVAGVGRSPGRDPRKHLQMA